MGKYEEAISVIIEWRDRCADLQAQLAFFQGKSEILERIVKDKDAQINKLLSILAEVKSSTR